MGKQFYGDEENEEKWERVEDPGEGDIVAVPGSSDHYWYRAVIVAKEEEEDEKENHFWVRLLDYGAFIKVAQSNIMVLRNEKDFEFVTKVPFQAIFASFPRDLVVKAASKGEEEEQK